MVTERNAGAKEGVVFKADSSLFMFMAERTV